MSCSLWASWNLVKIKLETDLFSFHWNSLHFSFFRVKIIAFHSVMNEHLIAYTVIWCDIAIEKCTRMAAVVILKNYIATDLAIQFVIWGFDSIRFDEKKETKSRMKNKTHSNYFICFFFWKPNSEIWMNLEKVIFVINDPITYWNSIFIPLGLAGFIFVRRYIQELFHHLCTWMGKTKKAPTNCFFSKWATTVKKNKRKKCP